VSVGRSAEQTWVIAGVLPGDSLVVKGPRKLHDGDKVESGSRRKA